MPEDDSTDKRQQYAVGYGKPPAHSQFQKGKSGNPRGRPKGALNVATVLQKTLRQKVVVNAQGERKTITKLEAAITQLVNKAASGDLRAVAQLTPMAINAEQNPRSAEPDEALTEVDEQVMLHILQRYGQSHGGSGEDPKSND